MRRLTAFVFVLAGALTSCSGGGGSGGSSVAPEFYYENSVRVTLGLEVTLDGAPVGGARVQVLDALPAPGVGQTVEELIGGNVYWNGSTSSAGRCDARLRVPTTVATVDVLVQYAGASGPYTVAQHRLEWGTFAPSSRTTLTRQALEDASVALISD